MGWKDLMKNVTDKATSVAETAQAKFEEQKQLSAIKKEEQNKKMEEMNERVTEYEQELLQNILSGFSGAPCIEVEDNILDFTKDYFEKLLLPANSVSASKITMYPYSDKIQKKAQKSFEDPKITLSVYSHVSKDKESLVADMLEDVLFSAMGE